MEAPASERWRARLRGWRGWLFVLLGTYAVGVTGFLIAGGGGPSVTSLVAMEAEVEGDRAQAEAASPSTADQLTTASQAGATDTQATSPSTTLKCRDVSPADHDVNPSLRGVHALGFATLDEQPASFAGYLGCPLVVNFFASWCVPCVTEMPDFERFWNAHGDSVAVLGLAANDRLEDAIETVAERGVTYPTGLDEGELFIDFGGLGMPTTVFISPVGEILDTHSGLLTLDDLTNRAKEYFGI